MSDNVRAELAEVARRARRMIERERAGGHGELLMASVAEARRSGVGVAVERATAPTPVTAEASAAARPAPDSAPSSPAILDAPPASAFDAATDDADSLFDQATSGGVFAGGAKGGPLNPKGMEARVEIDRTAQPVLDQIAAEVRVCEKCALSKTRNLGVPGVGSAKSGIVFVGEGPGADEDRLGEPFVGRAGQLLDKIIEAMDQAQLIPGVKLDRSTVFIGNIVHCRPPENRVPLPNEVEQSSPYLLRQLEALKPRIICCLGKTAAEALLGDKGALGSMRGRIYRFHGAKMIVTYHPAACLRNPAFKRPVWEDMQLLAREYLND